ncbi:hypothetical protein A1O3_06063 [Capronia epimyces CBS 606.96]|uniref:Uncharacterized protein n=1 Tax=Capronia epimyces CBS 606.96 TaxID=1182542 RepID=W9XXZ2_9EURO|nr:uncharacterized protein A1O3_06063 [Capronia epimyces CBS 606.96]EXJ82250.1 hypothetical protein A1O3_06063 [Capronia epimyces CBS 606.96]
MHWFQGVLISQVPANALKLDIESIVGKTILFGRQLGKPDFQIGLFSIYWAVLLEVHDAPIPRIRRSDIMSICDPSSGEMRCKSNKTKEADTCTCSRTDLLSTIHSGFVALQDLFGIASRRAVSSRGHGRLPGEVYAENLQHCDHETYTSSKCASRTLQALYDAPFPFPASSALNVVKRVPSHKQASNRESGDPVGHIELADL